jgi:S-adenosylmethionine:tRNA ribosyltransferase-isomerase
MLTLDGSGEVAHRRIAELPQLLRAGDVLVVNDAATIPASIRGTVRGTAVEIRLAQHLAGRRWQAIALGTGDWRSDTNHRGKASLAVGDRVYFECGTAEIVDRTGSLLTIVLRGAPWRAVYSCGRPVQYSHVVEDLELWSVQTAYGSRPWSVEMPSAGRPLSWRILLALRQRGVELASVTHAAGLSATGDPDLDLQLPLPERYEIPQRTAALVRRARAGDARVVAVGTSVVRALEGAALASGGALSAGQGITDLRIEPAYRPQVVDAILSGIHDPSESHYKLLGAFSTEHSLQRLGQAATEYGYRSHEFGDLCLVMR